MMTAAAAIARILQEEGTEYLFCFPVSPLIDARAAIVLELPADVAAAEIELPVYRPAPAVRSGGDPANIREAVRLIRAAERPLLHVGQGVLWAEAWDELRALAEAVPAPVMTTLM